MRPQRLDCHISAATNSALALATGEFVALMDHDDLLPERALYEVAAVIDRHPDADLIYSDEDKVGDDGRRFEPYLKTDWNYDLLLGQNMVSHLGVYRRSLLTEVGGLREGFEGSQDYDLVLRLAVETARLKLPAQLVPGLLMYAAQDYWHDVDSRFPDDWPAMTRQALALSPSRVEDYVAALAGGGPLRPR